MSALKLLDLFSGIGGFSLGLERSGAFKTVAFCEIDPFCRRVLAKHWPEVSCYEDVTTLSGHTLVADGITVDAICGGFPCQDISLAGKGAGIEGERSGLWREFARLIGDIRPAYAIIENVAALKKRGLDRVLRDLASLGYDAEWHCIPASAVGAPQERDRIWIIAYRNQREQSDWFLSSVRWRDSWQGNGDKSRAATCATEVLRPAFFREQQNRALRSYWPQSWEEYASSIRGMDDGVSSRVDGLGALGNTLIPAIPEIIGLAIKQHMESIHGA